MTEAEAAKCGASLELLANKGLFPPLLSTPPLTPMFSSLGSFCLCVRFENCCVYARSFAHVSFSLGALSLTPRSPHFAPSLPHRPPLSLLLARPALAALVDDFRRGVGHGWSQQAADEALEAGAGSGTSGDQAAAVKGAEGADDDGAGAAGGPKGLAAAGGSARLLDGSAGLGRGHRGGGASGAEARAPVRGLHWSSWYEVFGTSAEACTRKVGLGIYLLFVSSSCSEDVGERWCFFN